MTSDDQTYNDLLPNPGFEIDAERTAVVITDPQLDFLSPDGVVWGVVGASVEEHNTVEHLKSLLEAAHGAKIRSSSRRTTTSRRITRGSSAARWRR